MLLLSRIVDSFERNIRNEPAMPCRRADQNTLWVLSWTCAARWTAIRRTRARCFWLQR